MKKVLVTGAKGFVGKNLVMELRAKNLAEVYEYDIDTPQDKLSEFCSDCDFVFHLAGVNRPKDEAEFMEGNFGFTDTLLNTLKEKGNKAPVLISSSIQAALDNPYGKSKKAGEERMARYAEETGATVYIYRLANLFGKWCRPNYNSVVATFCHKIAHDEEITINDPKAVVNLVYIDDVVEEFIRAMEGKPNKNGDYYSVEPVHPVSLGRLAELLYSFRDSRKTLSVADMNDAFEKKLYSTYLSYLARNEFSYPLKMNVDARGSFTEFLRLSGQGQVSVNVAKPGIVKGNHWHHTKNEKFLVVAGRGVIRFRNPMETEIIEYFVSGDKLEVVDIPTGYTHNIENIGDTDLITVMWANEPFDPEKPDTYFLEV
ncbi:MAG: capsular polysaccharide biosynthesis protein CapF [Clostridia bacterium]|nr:capsular polysaccharide biosynthesis protein CapF [Clostridia bacterium]MBQ3553335.1 capsular polysaccharide biosynthesis protein CapF [Clostridia bacterium]